MTDTRKPESYWHLDKRVNVSVIAVLIAQIFAGGVFYATTTTEIANLKIRMDRVEQIDMDREAELKVVATEIASLKTLAQTQAVLLGDIRDDLRALRSLQSRPTQGSDR